MTSQRNRAVRR